LTHHPWRVSESEKEKRQRIDSQENVLILFREFQWYFIRLISIFYARIYRQIKGRDCLVRAKRFVCAERFVYSAGFLSPGFLSEKFHESLWTLALSSSHLRVPKTSCLDHLQPLRATRYSRLHNNLTKSQYIHHVDLSPSPSCNVLPFPKYV